MKEKLRMKKISKFMNKLNHYILIVLFLIGNVVQAMVPKDLIKEIKISISS